jgi:hypothetical protein
MGFNSAFNGLIMNSCTQHTFIDEIEEEEEMMMMMMMMTTTTTTTGI